MKHSTYEPRTVKDHGTLIDLETGEMRPVAFEHDVPVEVNGKRKRRSRRVGMTYVMMDARSLGDLEVTPTEQRVISALLAVADRTDESRSRISTTLLAQRLGMHTSNVSKTLGALRKRDVVFKEGPGYWRVNPWYAFTGEWTEWDKVAKRFPEPVWKRGGDA